MSDLIDRQSAIDYFVRNVGWHDEDGYPVEDSDELRKIWTDLFNELPSAKSRWIPVTERLPEDGAEVWVTTEMLSGVTRARWHEDSNLWCHPYYSDCVLALRPIAWMPYERPEPWKGGAE